MRKTKGPKSLQLIPCAPSNLLCCEKQHPTIKVNGAVLLFPTQRVAGSVTVEEKSAREPQCLPSAVATFIIRAAGAPDARHPLIKNQ